MLILLIQLGCGDNSGGNSLIDEPIYDISGDWKLSFSPEQKIVNLDLDGQEVEEVVVSIIQDTPESSSTDINLKTYYASSEGSVFDHNKISFDCFF